MLVQTPIYRTSRVSEYHARTRNGKHSQQKCDARGTLLQLAHHHLAKQKQTRILSMPGAWWHFEQKALDRWDLSRPSFICCENDPLIFVKAAVSMPHVGKRGIKCKKTIELGGTDCVTNGRDAVLIKCNIFDYLKVTDKQFRMVWLDMMGPITERLLASFTDCARVLQDHSVLAINVLVGRESLDVTYRMRKFQNRVDFIQSELDKACPGFRLVHRVTYSDSEHHQATRLQLAFVRGESPVTEEYAKNVTAHHSQLMEHKINVR